MSTLRISNIEAKSVPASATTDEKIKITNSSGDVLVFLDGKTSGITTVGINTTDGNITFDANSNVVVTGIITATKFVGAFEPTDLPVSGDLSISDKIIHIGDTNTAIRFPAADTITAETGGSERLRITSAGAVGINTDVSGNGGGAKLVVGGRIQSNAGGYWFTGANGAEDGWHVQDSGGNFVVYESGVAERLRIDSNGKIGVGGAPSAWQASTISNVLQLGTACLFNYNNDYFHVGQNFYWDGSNYKYVANDPATRLLQDNGQFTFYGAASGSADANITWIERLRIDSSGDITIPDSIIHQGDTDTKIRFPEDNKISFMTGGTERLRIDNVGVLYTGNYSTTLDATPGSVQMSGGTAGARLSLRGTTTSAYGGLGEMHGFWDTNKVASILFHAGSDTTNKDDGEIRMYTRTSGGSSAERLGISSLGNIRWRAGSVHQRKTGSFLGINGATTSDIKISGSFENNDMIRVRWAYNWNAGDGGAWGEAVIWKQYEGTKRVRYLTDVKASPLTSVSFPHSGNDIWLRWQTNAGINGWYMIDVETHGCEPFPF